MRLTGLLLAVLVLCSGTNMVRAGGTDINMVVAFDRSESISIEERDAQVLGLVHALTDPGVIQAIQSGWIGQIGITVITWSSFRRSDVLLPWTSIADRADAEAAANQLLGKEMGPFAIQHGRLTDIGFGIGTALQHLAEAPWFGRKQVINLVADGISNIGHDTIVDRNLAVSQGVTINGLVQGRGSAIEVLTSYFKRQVIGGPSAFVMSATDGPSFADAMLRKMELEIALLNDLKGM